MKHRLLIIPLLAGSLLLVACGGTTPTNTPPAMATTAPPATVAATTAAAQPTTAPTTAPPTTAPASSPAPAASPTKPATTAATSATPRATTAATPRSTGSSAGGVMKDQSGTCQITVPAGFNTLTPGLWTDGTATLVLVASPTGGSDFATYVKTIPALLGSDSSVKGFVPGKVDQQPDRYRLDFTAESTGMDPTPANGILVAVPATGPNVCIMQFFYHRTDAAKYSPIAEQLAPTVQAVKP